MAIACLMHEERRRKGDPPRAEQKITPAPRTTNHSVVFFSTRKFRPFTSSRVTTGKDTTEFRSEKPPLCEGQKLAERREKTMLILVRILRTFIRSQCGGVACSMSGYGDNTNF